ncbi:MAG: PD-(D/E)XK nuclease family protein [Kiritimatiellae bacterium]|nr:PD-(D/E)XK nuclease family protein [Kiritimatiellia bacterium]
MTIKSRQHQEPTPRPPGHIDILQFSYGKLWILDYKPDAKKESAEKVITQLSLYATALRYRAKVKIEDIACVYFDEKSSYDFKPELI